MDCYGAYERYLVEEKKASPNTSSSYLRDVRQYLQWLEGHTEGSQPLPVQWFALTEQNIARLSG